MRSNLIRCLCVSTLLFAAPMPAENSKAASNSREEEVQVVQMTAKKYEFSPAEVHIKQGMRVRLTITAIDRDHGFNVTAVPNGADSSRTPGLEFAPLPGNDGWKLKKDKEATIEFVAKTAGVYELRCSVACGIDHGRMKGQLIVEPRVSSKRTSTDASGDGR